MTYIAAHHCPGTLKSTAHKTWRFCLSHTDYSFKTLQDNQGSVRGHKATFSSHGTNYFFCLFVCLFPWIVYPWSYTSVNKHLMEKWELFERVPEMFTFPADFPHSEDTDLLFYIMSGLQQVWKAICSKCSLFSCAFFSRALRGDIECFVGIFLNS